MDLERLVSRYFGRGECSSAAMKRAVEQWYQLYFEDRAKEGYDPCLRLPYTIVRKLTSAVFAEYEGPAQLQSVAREAVSHALIGGESYLKPLPGGWIVIPRTNVMVTVRSITGEPVEVFLAEQSVYNGKEYLLMERRYRAMDGLEIEHRLFRENKQVRMSEHPAYEGLPEHDFVSGVEGVGLVRVHTPMVNCIDGSREGVSVYAPAVGLLQRIAENEAQLAGEFKRGQSRLVVSRDMLRGGQLMDDTFISLDEDPDRVGITVFAPELREQSYLNRQQAYLRSVENAVGLKRGLLSQVEAVDRTATEITSSEGEYAATIRDFQKMWEQAAQQALELRAQLEGREAEEVQISWGDGVLGN